MNDHLLDTAIGAALALSGTILSQFFGLFSGKFERKHRDAALARERLEKISDCIGEGILWSQVLLTLKSFDGVRDSPIPNGVRRAVMLSRIHFRDLEEPGINYMNCLIAYQRSALGAFRSDAPGGATIGAQMFLNSPEAKDLAEKLLSLRNAFDDAIAKEAKKYEP